MITALTRAAGIALILPLLGLCTNSSEACRGRTACCIPCCPPCDYCCVYSVSHPIVHDIDHPPKVTRIAHLGHGVIAQFDIFIGPKVLKKIEYAFAGPGEMRYTDFNACTVNPCLIGGPTRYSFFLCPTKAGDCTFTLYLYFTDGTMTTMTTVPYRFKIEP